MANAYRSFAGEGYRSVATEVFSTPVCKHCILVPEKLVFNYFSVYSLFFTMNNVICGCRIKLKWI